MGVPPMPVAELSLAISDHANRIRVRLRASRKQAPHTETQQGPFAIDNVQGTPHARQNQHQILEHP